MTSHLSSNINIEAIHSANQSIIYRYDATNLFAIYKRIFSQLYHLVTFFIYGYLGGGDWGELKNFFLHSTTRGVIIVSPAPIFELGSIKRGGS